MAGNDAIHANPSPYNTPIDITVRGSDFLWMVFAVMLASAVAIVVLGFRQPQGKRAFHWCSVAILFTAATAYFSMASNLGQTPVLVEFNRQRSDLYEGSAADAYRAIWYARYIDWTITTPLLLLDLLLATGMPTSTIFFTVFMDLVMIITGLIGALVVSSYKWGYFAGGCVAMLMVFGILVTEGRTSAYAMGKDVGSAYIKSAALLSFLWFLYPIAWGLADGGNVITPDGEMIFYGVLDLLAKPGFIFFHLFAVSKLDYSRFAFSSGHWTVDGADSFTGEKSHNVNHKYISAPNGTSAGKSNGVAANGNLTTARTNDTLVHGHNTTAAPAIQA